MAWNYRIVRYRNGDGYGIHEVYYDDEGKPWSMTANPCTFAADTVEEIKEAIALAFADAERRPVFDEPEVWPGEPRGLREALESLTKEATDAADDSANLEGG